MSECLFCQIIGKKLPAEIIQEDNKIIVFKDIHPKASVHLLIVPKIHIISLNELEPSNQNIVFYALSALPKLAKAQGLTGYRTIINTGRTGGQEVDHLHLHLLAGDDLPGF